MIDAMAEKDGVDEALEVAGRRGRRRRRPKLRPDGDTARWPPNAIRFYRELAGLSQAELGKETDTSHQQIYRLENRQRKLDPEWAVKLARPLGCSPEDLAYSSAPNAYSWAIKAVPVVGQLIEGMQITHVKPEDSARQRAIGVLGAAEHTVAIEITAAANQLMAGLYLLYRDTDDARLKMTPKIVDRQRAGQLFVVSRKQEADLWFRKISMGSRRNRYHLIAAGFEQIVDTEIAWVSEMTQIVPGRRLPEED
jgi:transcriptional regulator with XRE-family HTH domain